MGVVPIHQRAGDLAAWLQGKVRRGRRRRVEFVRVLGRYRGEEEDVFLKKPLASFSLIAKRSSSNFSELNGAFRHFF